VPVNTLSIWVVYSLMVPCHFNKRGAGATPQPLLYARTHEWGATPLHAVGTL